MGILVESVVARAAGVTGRPGDTGCALAGVQHSPDDTDLPWRSNGRLFLLLSGLGHLFQPVGYHSFELAFWGDLQGLDELSQQWVLGGQLWGRLTVLCGRYRDEDAGDLLATAWMVLFPP